MKHFTLLFLMLASAVFAQDRQTKNFFADITKGTVYYTDGWMTESNLNSLKAALKDESIKNDGLAGTNTLTLTDSEKKSIKKEAKKLIGVDVKDYLSGIANFEYVPQFDAAKHKSSSFYSKPIFIRSNTICFVYSSSYSGPKNAAGGWNIYKKENGKWVQWIQFASWES